MSDLISRQDAIDKAILIPIAKIVTEDKVIYRRVIFIEDIESLPSAERKGHWVYTAKKRLDGETDDGAVYVTDYWCTCSECGSDFGYIKMSDKYCKYCGARVTDV